MCFPLPWNFEFISFLGFFADAGHRCVALSVYFSEFLSWTQIGQDKLCANANFTIFFLSSSMHPQKWHFFFVTAAVVAICWHRVYSEEEHFACQTEQNGKKKIELDRQKTAAGHCCCRTYFVSLCASVHREECQWCDPIQRCRKYIFDEKAEQREPQANIVWELQESKGSARMGASTENDTLHLWTRHSSNDDDTHTQKFLESNKTLNRKSISLCVWMCARVCVCVSVSVRYSVALCTSVICIALLIKTRHKLISCNMKHIFSISFVPVLGWSTARAQSTIPFHLSLLSKSSFFTILCVQMW